MDINLCGPVNKLSYGIVTTNIVKELYKRKVKVSLFPIGMTEVQSQEDKNIISECIVNGQFYNKNAPCIRIYHQNKLDEFVGKGSHIGFPIFELDTFTPLESHHLNSCDKLFVCSGWAQSILERNGIQPPSSVIPLGVDTSIFYPRESTPKNKYIFLNIGKFEVRKGHKELIEIFNEWSKDKNDVELWMMSTNHFNTTKEDYEWKSLMGPNIKVVPFQNSQEDVARIINMADCGIFPTKAEGWGLPILEMMACGKPVITTYYSGQTEYLRDSENQIINNTQEKELAYDGKWFYNQGSWLRLDEHAKLKMSELLFYYYNNRPKIVEENVSIAEKFTWRNTVDKILLSLD